MRPAVIARRSSPPRSAGAGLARLPAQGLFVTGALSQYVGSAFAVKLFASVPAAGVAWLRVVSAAVVLVAWRRPWRSTWTARRAGLVAAFGGALALMNLCFYLAIARLPLGTAVAIEFAGPITVAALGSRTRRDIAALALAAVGVLALADVHLSGSPGGVALALAAGALWGAYIVLGHRVAADSGIRPQDGLAAAMAVGALALAPALVGPATPALTDPALLAACVAVGLAASVVPYALEQLAMRRLPRARFALLLSLLPATAAVVGAVVLGQVPSALEAAGIALVVVASSLRTHQVDHLSAGEAAPGR
ncbi:MAG TPA: EamA family transporter [Solirubrobacteraceae bacterium]